MELSLYQPDNQLFLNSIPKPPLGLFCKKKSLSILIFPLAYSLPDCTHTDSNKTYTENSIITEATWTLTYINFQLRILDRK